MGIVAGAGHRSAVLASPSVKRVGGAARTHATLFDVKAVGVAMAFYLLAGIGPVSAYDASIFAVGLSALAPGWAPCLLVLALSVHDAPGMATPSLYFTVAGIGVTLLGNWLRHGKTASVEGANRMARLATAGILTLGYGLLISFYQGSFGGYPQSPDRHFAVITCLGVGMIVTAVLAGHLTLSSPTIRRRLATACLLSVGHALLIATLQIWNGPLFGSSTTGAMILFEDNALVDPGMRNVSRLTGPFLTPNNLGVATAVLLLTLLTSLRTQAMPLWFLALYATAGPAASLLGSSRSMMAYFAATTGILCWSRSRLLSIALLAGAAGWFAWSGVDSQGVAVLVRLEGFDFHDSTRFLLWSTTIDRLDRIDWFTGIGVSAWDTIFADVYQSSRISDPHNWVLAVVGGFGLVGVWFYWRLLREVIPTLSSPSRATRAVGLCLLTLVFVRDLVAAQNILNNHPSVCLNWLLICLHLGSCYDASAADRTKLPARRANKHARRPLTQPRLAEHPQQQHGDRSWVRAATRRARRPEPTADRVGVRRSARRLGDDRCG